MKRQNKVTTKLILLALYTYTYSFQFLLYSSECPMDSNEDPSCRPM